MHKLERKMYSHRSLLTEKQESVIRDRIEMLSVDEQMVIYFRFWDGLSDISIARRIGVSIALVRELLSNALIRLRDDFLSIAQRYYYPQLINRMELAA